MRAQPRRLRSFFSTTACGLLALPACGEPASSRDRPELTVFAAASATDVVTALRETFDRARVRTSTGPSSGLARQIEDGAPADVFVSANRRWIEHLRAAGLLRGEPRVLWANRLVCIAAPGSTLAERRPADAAQLAGLLAPGDRVAIADAGVPAGEYARQSLAATGDLDRLRGRLVGQVDARSALRAVASGQAAAGFVYATDARAGGVEVLFALDPATHDRIEYVAAVTAAAADPDLARAFVDHLRSAAARRILADAGFVVDEEGR